MDEIEDLAPPIREGHVVRDSTGDRLLVGLGGLVLVGGLLIATANLFQLLPSDRTAIASMSPAGTDDQEQTSTPQPASRILHEISVEPFSIPSRVPPWMEPQPAVAESWLEAIGEVPVLRSPNEGGEVLTTLAPGTVVVVRPHEEHEGWLLTRDPLGFSAYVDGRGEANRARFALYPVSTDSAGGSIDHVVGGPDRLLAWVSMPDAGRGRSGLYVSTEGEQWGAVDAASSVAYPVASGPSGWISLYGDMWANRSVVHTSHDGSAWDAVGSLRAIRVQGDALVGSELGYLLVNALSDIRYAPTVWYSPDGLTWQESVDPFDRSGVEGKGQPIRLLATPSAFVAWTTRAGSTTDALVAISRDGHRWSQVTTSEAVSGDLQLVAVGDRLLGVASVSDGQVAAYSADLSAGGQVAMFRLGGFGATDKVEIASSATEAYALGQREGSLAPVVWRSAGGEWLPFATDVPSDLGASPRIGAVGPAGLVVIGSRPTAAGDNPIFWHLRADGSWVAEPDPLIPVVPDPPGDVCGPLPATALQFVLLRASTALACFGDTPLTFSAWASCECFVPQSIADQAEWSEWEPALLLSPVSGDGDHGAEAWLDPDSGWKQGDFWNGLWARVTGHFDDPRSESCASDPDQPSARGEAVTFCRERFVVIEVVAVETP